MTMVRLENGLTLEFNHTAVNKDIHMFIGGVHDPNLCAECIESGALTRTAQVNTTGLGEFTTEELLTELMQREKEK